MFFLWRCSFVNDINTLSCTVCALIKDPSQICGKRLHFCLCLCLMLNDIEVQSSCVLTLIPALFGWHLHGSMEFHTIEIDCPLDFCSFISEHIGTKGKPVSCILSRISYLHPDVTVDGCNSWSNHCNSAQTLSF